MIRNLSLTTLGIIFIFITVLVLSLYLKLAPTLNYNFPFTMDQARDMLDIRAMIELKKPVLIGPTTSINGVFLGPFYYYFNLIPFVASGGDPATLTYWNIGWYMAAGVVMFFFFYKENKVFGLISSVIFLMAPAMFYSSRYFWNANPMPYMTIFYFLSLLFFIKKKDKKSSFLVGLISGLSMQLEAAFGVLFLPFFIIFSAARKTSIKFILTSIGAFFITIIPQLVFELRHGFVMTKTFLNEISGQSQTLGEKLNFQEIVVSHATSFINFSSELFQVPTFFGIVLLTAAFVYLCIKFFLKKLDPQSGSVFLVSTFFVLFAFSFYMFYSYPLKGWYLLGLRIPYILLISLFLTDVFNVNIKIPIFKILVIIFLGWSFYATYLDQSKFIMQDFSDRSTDKSNLRNEIEAIDWVYQKAEGRGFKAYNYIPSVYDFPYQYLYWWHGGKQYGYHPETITYLDNVPEYIKDNDKFLTLKKPQENSFIFLIYEPDENPDRLAAWLGNFTKFCTKDRKIFLWGTTVEFREPCKF